MSYLICGGSTKSGAAIARNLIERGEVCVLVGRTEPAFKLNANSSFIKTDFGDENQVLDLCKELEESHDIKNLIFFQRSHSRDLKEALEVSLIASEKIISQLESQLIRNKGSMIFIGSILGTQTDMNQSLAYHVAKSALKPMMQYFAVKYAPHGVRSNLINLSTLVYDENIHKYEEKGLLKLITDDVIPLRKAITIVDLQNCIDFLVSDKSSGITAEEVYLDGGLSKLSQVGCIQGVFSKI